ncbi:molybdate ABC transporter substrate-binding protein [Desulfosporosinus sp. BICA1-9]|uniref:molybdate ABC transporter substrate-binding protein n=1 Tax=Desulfosporosinus sp. BICA1-9 TaxID=1531958 RepID=UPI00054C5251|nr:molybdate ABC transporter substrate-binding protein [Desulfosporosinus sp. BICA1-9]KJS47075.1 MAG: molybdate ABC transporter substrate-binding protein [Peptococcaceae bacterium BRH_c23]KJS86801.1 MAG: molybdate ABC transporter substrate-binding protein [Desulfosporosinus sp. BICA1-9]HBW37852.1 molybdate ABC transporter substrate-binding protein [Desulfosporosinus sp.]
MDFFNQFRKSTKTQVAVRLVACLLCLLVLVLSGCSNAVKETPKQDDSKVAQTEAIELMISTAPSLKGSFEEIKKLYSVKETQVNLVFNYGPSGSLQTQIEQGAATDIFISQGKPQMDALEQKGLVKKDSRVNLLGDELVLIVKTDNTTLKGFEDLTKPEVKHIGIGEAESVPAAKTTKETLSTLKLWDTLQSKMVIGKDLMQVMAYVETGNAEAGFVWDTIAITSDKVKIVASAPANSHTPVVLPAAVVTASKNSEAAVKFMAYLQSDEAMKIFEKNGFIKGK